MKKPLGQFSFEFYPPKTFTGTQQLLINAQKLARVKPNYFSVTFGAGGTTREGTLATLQLLQKKTSIAIAPHLSCLGYKQEDILNLLKVYQSLGITKIVAIRGDLSTAHTPMGDFNFAHELVSFIRKVSASHFQIHVAAYPEVHPQATNARTDLLNLKKKYEAGANAAITQYFYNADAYLYLLEACAKEHIALPITPGIMPINHFSKLVRFSKLCGAEIPRWLYKRLEAYGKDEQALQAFALDFICDFCQQLLTAGAPGLHFYTLNQADLSLQIMKRLNLPVATQCIA